MKKKIGSSKSMKKMQKGGTMSPLDSMKYYGNKYDSLSAEAAKKIGTKVSPNKDLREADKARANETRLAKKIYGTGPGIPQKKKGGSVKKYQAGGTPFQQYVNKYPGSGSDTTARNDPRYRWNNGGFGGEKVQKNNDLKTAFNKTYGDNDMSGVDQEDEAKSRIIPKNKKGGSVGSSKKPKMAKGGSVSFGMLSVKKGVDNNPKPTAADRIAGATMKKGGTVKKSSKKK
jgi:hypothetical protein